MFSSVSEMFVVEMNFIESVDRIENLVQKCRRNFLNTLHPRATLYINIIMAGLQLFNLVLWDWMNSLKAKLPFV